MSNCCKFSIFLSIHPTPLTQPIPPQLIPLFTAAAIRGSRDLLLVAVVASAVRARRFPESPKPPFLVASAFRGRRVRQQPRDIGGGATGPRNATPAIPGL
jgi:hypothetical protein